MEIFNEVDDFSLLGSYEFLVNKASIYSCYIVVKFTPWDSTFFSPNVLFSPKTHVHGNILMIIFF